MVNPETLREQRIIYLYTIITIHGPILPLMDYQSPEGIRTKWKMINLTFIHFDFHLFFREALNNFF